MAGRMTGHHPWSEIRHKRDQRPSAEQRAWDEYLAWTRNADAGEYVATEERAWRRLERHLLWFGVAPYRVPEAPPPNDLLALPAPPPDAIGSGG